MKFLHIADLHLDARLESNLSPSKAKQRRRELTETFSRILAIGAEQGVDVVVCAGDLFDEVRVSDRTRDAVAAAIAEHPEMTFLYLRGNHDGGFGQEALPENVWSFASEEGAWTSYRFGNVVFTGTEKNALPDLYEALTLQSEDVNIVVMHGLDSTSSVIPSADTVCLKLLKNKGIDLLALGHLHSYKVGKLDKRGSYSYPGCPDGRGFDECGEKGVLLGEVDELGHITETWIPMSSRVLHNVRVDMAGILTEPELEKRVLEQTAEIPETDMVRVELIGDRDSEARCSLEQLTDALNRRFWFARVKDHSMLAIDPEDYIGDVSLKGEFIRSVLASRLSKQDKDLVIMTGLRALRGEEPDV